MFKSWLSKSVLTAGFVVSMSSSGVAMAQGDPQSVGGATIAALKREDFASVVASFDQAMQSAMPQDRLASVWADVKRQMGPMSACAEPSVAPNSARIVVEYQCTFAKGNLTLQLSVNSDGTLGGLFLKPPKP